MQKKYDRVSKALKKFNAGYDLAATNILHQIVVQCLITQFGFLIQCQFYYTIFI